MIAQPGKQAAAAPAPAVRRGVGALFGGPGPRGQPAELLPLAPMPERPTLVDFFRLRFTPRTVTHLLQSATDALRKGQPEETVFACLLHDIAINLLKVDHGWVAAQMLEPYVSEKVSWAIRYHQALRFYADAMLYSFLSHAQTAAPRYEADLSWPKPLPDRWVLGGLGGVCVDAQDHVLILNRQDVIEGDLNAGKLAPPLIEFDLAGNVVNSWGDAKLLDPRLHSCHFDKDGNVWIAASPSGMI